MTDPGSQKYSESTLRLAERYSIDPARLDAMLGSPGSAPSATPGVDQHMHQPNAVPPVPPTPPPVDPVKPSEPIRVQDPNIRPASASGSYVPPPKDIRAQGSTLSSPPRGSKTYTYEKRVSPATWLVGLLVLGALAMMYFWRSCNNDRASLPTTPPAAITDTVVKTDTVATVDTVVTPAPVPAADATPAQPRRRTAARRASSSGSRNVALTTTSSFSAQERAAELKADGNPNAHVRTRQKNGVTVYEVRTRK